MSKTEKERAETRGGGTSHQEKNRKISVQAVRTKTLKFKRLCLSKRS